MYKPTANGHQAIIQTRLYAMLAARLGHDEQNINDDLHLVDELYVDSLDLVEIEIGVAETFGVALSEDNFFTMQTVADLRGIITEKIALQET